MMDFKGKITFDIDKEGWMILAHQGGLSEYTTELKHFEKILVREESETEHVDTYSGSHADAPMTPSQHYRKDTTSRVPVYAYVCVVSAHVVIGGVPGARTISLRSDTLRRKKPIGQDNLVATADTSATKAAIKFALGITKEDIQEIAKELKLDHTKVASKVIIPEDAADEDDEVTSTLSEEELKQAKKSEEELWT
jgi:hypothetical protein